MSKNINVNAGHYKVAGRERQGQGILQSSQKGAYAQQRHEERRQAIEAQAGLPAWETTPPNLEVTERPEEQAVEKKALKKRAEKRTGRRTVKRARKAAPKRKTARVQARSTRRRPGASTATRRTRRTGAQKK